MAEDETSRFLEFFANDAYHNNAEDSVQEVVFSLHDETLAQLTGMAQTLGISGSNELTRSIALQVCLDRFLRSCAEPDSKITDELRLGGGNVKPRLLCIFKRTIEQLGEYERSYHCSETILLETAVRNSSVLSPQAV